jgi:hypothetical protein
MFGIIVILIAFHNGRYFSALTVLTFTAELSSKNTLLLILFIIKLLKKIKFC